MGSVPGAWLPDPDIFIASLIKPLMLMPLNEQLQNDIHLPYPAACKNAGAGSFWGASNMGYCP